MRPALDLGIADRGERHRQHRGGECERDGGEEKRIVRISHAEQQWSNAGGSPGRHHIGGEDASTCIRARFIVEPTLHHHKESGNSHADHPAECGPGKGHSDKLVQKRGIGGQYGKCAEGPDVTHAVNDPVAEQSANQETGVVGGGNQTNEACRGATLDELDAGNGTQRADRQFEEHHRGQHRKYWPHHALELHLTPLRPSLGPIAPAVLS